MTTSISRTAVITGGGGLLGVEHASALIDIGFAVCLVDINSDSLKSASSIILANYPDASLHLFQSDISNESEVALLVNRLEEAFTRIDVLINSAAVNSSPTSQEIPDNTVENFSLERWNSELSVGLTGTFLMCKYVGETMRRNRGGIIVNIASDLSIIAPDQRIYKLDDSDVQFYKPVTYSAVKAGVIGITKYLATYWAPHGIRVNALSPGGVLNGQPIEFQRKIVNLIPLNRMAQPDEYRGAIQFLCTDASKYMTGQNLVIDGGRSVW